MKTKILLCVACAFLFLSNTALADHHKAQVAETKKTGERILHFSSDIFVAKDAGVTITETIKVQSEGKSIKRGIYRWFPKTYRDKLGTDFKVDYHIISVLRNGKPSPYHIKETREQKKLYIGAKKVLISKGIHTYKITYHTKHQIGYFKNFDELYWNVTGNYWKFPIDKVTATLTLPHNTPILKYVGYTGRLGSTLRNYTTEKLATNQIKFSTTKTFSRGEGMTVALSWPKGFVYEPNLQERIMHSIMSNVKQFIALFFLCLITLYYLLCWYRIGRGPKKGTIIPLFEPPAGFSPAAIRFINRMSYDATAFTTAVISMATKGYLTIMEDDGTYQLNKIADNEEMLSKGETKIAKKLFPRKQTTIKLKNKQHNKINQAMEAFRKTLKQEFQKVYFLTNSKYLLPGFIFTAITLFIIIDSSYRPEQATFFTVWLSMWSVACYAIAKASFKQWRLYFKNKKWKTLKQTALTSALAIPFGAALVVGITQFASILPPLSLFTTVGLIVTNLFFHHIMRAPTLRGRKLMDQIEGFKQFLSKAEQLRLERMNPPDKTPELFEKYLPYALALGVETQWSAQFDGVLQNAANPDDNYQPTWYFGTDVGGFNTGSFASTIGMGLSSAIATSATAPGSSSGSGGGGSSGGGGGGGGGGGW